MINIVGALGLASIRVAMLMKIQKYLGGNQDRFDEMLDKIVDDITKDWPIRKALERKIKS